MTDLEIFHSDYKEYEVDGTKINNKDEGASENMMYMVACGPGAEELLQEIYNNYDGEEFFIFEENLSRKADVVPAVTEALK